MENTKNTLIHPFSPISDEACDTLILGSFPSERSRADGFYYAHPRNRFWPLLAALYADEPGYDAESRTRFLLRHHLALWDAAASCTVTGSSDASVRDVLPNDIAALIRGTAIRRVFCNGALAYQIYTRCCEADTRLPAARLPSTSPANAAFSFEKLCEAWRVLIVDNMSRP